jgi:hypothetical protein
MNVESLEALVRPFTQIKTRPGRNGKVLNYLEGHQVIARLNEAFNSNWSFRVLQHEIAQHEVIVLGELRVGELVKHAFGGSELTRARESGKSLSVADDLKAAATDALKKAATLLGVGLHLYGDLEVAEQPAQPATTSPGNGSNGSRLTRKQLSYIHRLSQDQGMDRGDLETLCRGEFRKTTAYLSAFEASALIDQLKVQPGRQL